MKTKKSKSKKSAKNNTGILKVSKPTSTWGRRNGFYLKGINTEKNLKKQIELNKICQPR